MDRGSPPSIRGPKKDTLNSISFGSTQGTREALPLHSSAQQRSKNITRRRAHRRRQGPEHPEADLLPQHATEQVPAAVPTLPEAIASLHHDFKEGVALFRRAPDHRSKQRPTRGHTQ